MKKVKSLKATDVIAKIIVNITIGSKLFKDVELNIENDDKWWLTFEDIHYEDNGSWTLVKVGEDVFDVQIYGNDDSQGLKSALRMQGCLMEYDENDKCYSHTNDWLTQESFSKVRLVTTDGRIKSVRLDKRVY